MRQMNELTELIRELYNISGFRVTVHDTELREIESYPPELSAFCGWVQGNPRVRTLCEDCDAKAFQKVQQTKELYIYQCHCGLYEAVAPLYDFGVLVGYLMMGQMLDTMVTSRHQVEQLAWDYREDKAELHRMVEEIPTTTKEKITSYLRILSVCAEYITLTNRLNLGSRNLADEVGRYLRRHYVEKLSMEMLAHQFFVSKSTLMNAFKKRFGKTVNQYLTEFRLEQAKKLLERTTLSINEVAEACGFSDQNYFTKVFVKGFGKTPSAYRAQR